MLIYLMNVMTRFNYNYGELRIPYHFLMSFILWHVFILLIKPMFFIKLSELKLELLSIKNKNRNQNVRKAIFDTLIFLWINWLIFLWMHISRIIAIIFKNNLVKKTHSLWCHLFSFFDCMDVWIFFKYHDDCGICYHI